MAHLQAFHTSCREGLSGTPGFQFNAASPELSPEALRALAGAHAGYHAPPGCPPEPTAEQLAAFPVALKHRAVDGVGPVVSRTVYVGRELRGRGGEPDSGRFGNYFSHLVVGSDGEDPFDGLLPIELWGAAHWTTSESDERTLPPLGPLGPGTLDLDTVLGMLDGARRAWLEPVLDAVLAALGDGPRVVVVEPEARCAGAWVAWASYALPPAMAARLSFTTYSGRPRHGDDVQLCVTTPDADLAFASYELSRSVTLLGPVDRPPQPAPASLYARVARALADEGAEAVAQAVRRVDPAGLASPEALGAAFAVASGRAGLAGDAEISGVLGALAESVRSRRWEEAAAALDALPAVAPASDVRAWAVLHAAARAASDAAAQEIADGALDRLLPHVDRLPEELPGVAADAPTRPSPDRLARWLDAIEASGPDAGAVIRGGLTLGLAGCNAALDRRVTAAIADGISQPGVRAAFDALAAREQHGPLVEATVALLAERAESDDGAFEALASVATRPAVLEVVRRHVQETGTLAARTTWERLRVRRDPHARPAAIDALLRQPGADEDAAGAAVRSLFGARGPATLAEHLELIDGYVAARLRPPNDDLERASIALAELPLEERAGRRLEDALRAAHPGMRQHPLVHARALVAHDPPRTCPFGDWAREAVRVAAASPRHLPDARRAELTRAAGRAVARSLAEGDHDEGLALLTRSLDDSWPVELARGLRYEMKVGRRPERVAATAFGRWRRGTPQVAVLLDTALVLALEDRSPRWREGVGEQLDEADREGWERWLEAHEPERGRGPVGRLLGGRRKER